MPVALAAHDRFSAFLPPSPHAWHQAGRRRCAVRPEPKGGRAQVPSSARVVGSAVGAAGLGQGRGRAGPERGGLSRERAADGSPPVRTAARASSANVLLPGERAVGCHLHAFSS